MPADSTPLYVQLASQLAHGIRSGAYPLEHALPSERVLSESMQVSRITARKAIDLLVDKGLVVRRHGSGNFIASREPQGLTRLTSFSEQLATSGHLAQTIWLNQKVDTPDDAERTALRLPPSAQVARLNRLRLADGIPVALEVSVVPLTVLPDPQEMSGSLYEYLQSQGHAPDTAKQLLRALSADKELARHLQIPVATAVLWVTRTSFDAAGVAVEFTHTYCRSDYYTYTADLRRNP